MTTMLTNGIAELIYHHIAINKKPKAQPYKTNIVHSEHQCFAYCMHDQQCYAFGIHYEKLQHSCHFYNQSTPKHHLASTKSRSQYYSEFRDCQDWYDYGVRASGVYQVNWMGRVTMDVRCNMGIDDGGWMTLQRRFNGSLLFHNRTWEGYKKGFGKIQGEFWFGLDLMHEMTSSGEYFFLAVAETFQGKRGISKYGHFEIENEENFYKLHFNETLLEGIHSLYNKNAKHNANGMKFTTADHDNDNDDKNCAKQKERGAFWFNDCHPFHPNGLYFEERKCKENSKGFKWSQFNGNGCLQYIEMMIKKM